jgi:hypothetical protein
MIEDLDEALRQLFIRELPIKNGEVDVKFDQPKREWSARLSRPTLNLFLYDVRENTKRRATQELWERVSTENGTVTLRRRPIRVDLHYMITAWATDAQDEHHLLSRALMALFRCPELPAELLPKVLQDQPVPILLMAGQQEELQNPSDVWSALDNEIRPAIPCVVTMALNPYLPVTGPLVRTRELRFGQSGQPRSEKLDEPEAAERWWTIGGRLHSARPLENVRLTLVERGWDVPLQPEGRFAIGRLEAGDYTLEVAVDGRSIGRYPLSVPSPDYDLEV